MDESHPIASAEVAAGADAGLTTGYDLGDFFDEMLVCKGTATARLEVSVRIELLN